MRSSSFDVPAAMGHWYALLQEMGFVKACRTQVPDEWKHPHLADYIRSCHVGGYVEIWWYPFGKKSRTDETVWRRAKDAGDRDEFIAWLDGIAERVRSALGDPLALH